MKSNRAFTLIELLVVIAIIAILAAIVLVSLSSAQNRAKDAKIQATLNQLRNQAQIIASESTSGTDYSNVTSGNSNISRLYNDLISTSGGASYVVITSNANGYCASARLVSNTLRYWCVDSDLNSNETNAACTSPTSRCR